MKILVCISNVPDTTTRVKFVGGKALDPAGIQWIINPWDELALTRALELKEAHGSLVESVTVIGVGEASSEPTLRKALAIGADAAIRVNTAPAEAYTVALQLAEAVRQGGFDLIFCGIESSDYNGSSVGMMLAENLQARALTSVSRVDFAGSEALIDREVDGGKETLACGFPLVAIVQKGIALEPRIPSMRGIMTARTKPLSVVEAVPAEPLTEYLAFELPPAKSACRMVAPENTAELVSLLRREAKVI